MQRQINSIRRSLHSILASPQKSRREWGAKYWQENGKFHDIACHQCPKFNRKKIICTVPFGSPLRKCVVASIEAHLNSTKDQNILEIGFGRWAFARNLITRDGGMWTGIDPGQDMGKRAIIGEGRYGHAAEIPFAADTFDKVFGIQTVVHWGQKSSKIRQPSEYCACLMEIWRVLKPGGTIYFDAPIYLHGHEMFIMGDLDRIRAIFNTDMWGNIIIERWRRDFKPLKRYPPNNTVIQDWPEEIVSYSKDNLARIKDEKSVWLLTITATKIVLT